MNDIYIRAIDVNKWISKYFKNKDLISIDDLISCIEDLDSEIESLKIEIKELKEPDEQDYEKY